MDTYITFAQVYDNLMDNIPYQEWFVWIKNYLHKEGVMDGLLLDLGCGTGTMTELLAASGYDMIGVDVSLDMLEIALSKKEQSGHDILYLQQDMREFELYGTVRAIICSCDCINYMLSKEEVLEVFTWVNNYLDPGGIFLFDFKTAHYYKNVLVDQTIAENREDCSFIWENVYDEEDEISDSELTIYVKQPKTDLFERYQEQHSQKGYTLEEMKDMISKSGMEFEYAYDGYTTESAHSKSERIVVIAREVSK